MKFHLISVLIVFFLSSEVISQTKNSEYAQAEEMLLQGKFESALNSYLHLLNAFPNSPILNYKAGLCYMHSRSQVARAAPYFEKAIQNSSSSATTILAHENDAPRDVCKLLGDACFSSHKFEQAITAYEKYREFLLNEKEKNELQLEQIGNKIETCRFALELKELAAQKPLDVVQDKMSEGLKSKISVPSDYTSSISSDKSSMIFTFKLPVSVYKKKTDDLRYFEDDELKPNSFKGREQKIAEDSVLFSTAVGTAVDGQAILTYRNENGKAALYLSYLRNDKWTAPQKLSECPNPSGWEPSEFLSADGNTLYFVSERAGGFGGKDIYYCSKNRDGSWSKARNAGAKINSPYDEIAPFLHPDGTLIFSSNRNYNNHFDIYSAQRSDSGLWMDAVNVGFPLENHLKESKALTSVKQIPEQKKLHLKQIEKPLADTLNDKRHFLVTYISPDLKSMAVLSGKIELPETDNAASVKVSVIDISDEKIQSVYYPEAKTREFAFVIPVAKNIGIFYEADGFLFQSEHTSIETARQYFEPHASIHLKPLAIDASTSLNNTFFKNGSAEILPTSHVELNKILELMKQHPSMKIQLISYVYDSKNKKSGMRLSAAKCRALKKYLTDRGIDQKMINCKAHLHKKIRTTAEHNEALHEKGNSLLLLRIISLQ